MVALSAGWVCFSKMRLSLTWATVSDIIIKREMVKGEGQGSTETSDNARQASLLCVSWRPLSPSLMQAGKSRLKPHSPVLAPLASEQINGWKETHITHLFFHLSSYETLLLLGVYRQYFTGKKDMSSQKTILFVFFVCFVYLWLRLVILFSLTEKFINDIWKIYKRYNNINTILKIYPLKKNYNENCHTIQMFLYKFVLIT